MEWDLKPISSQSPPCQDIPMVQRELGMNPAEHCSILPSPQPRGREKLDLPLFPIKACFGLGNPGKSHSLFMDCKQLACVMIPKSLGITLDIQMD